jgi:selenocysteine lyase/cysteine desulfurase
MGLLAAVEWQECVGREAIALHGRVLVHRLREQLEEIPEVEVLTPSHPELHASMLTFRSPRLDYGELFGRLWRKHGFRCRPVSERDLNAVRVSCHLFNGADEVDRLAAAVARELEAV